MTSMSPLFRKCGLTASQDILLYKSLYVNPLSCSDSPSPLQDEDEDEDQNHTSTTATTALLNSSSTLQLHLPRTSISSSSSSSSNSDFSTSRLFSAPSLKPLTSVAAIPSICTHSTMHISNALVQETYKDREDHRTNWTYISSQTEEDISGPTASCNYSHAAPALKNSNREPPAPTIIFPLIRVSAPKCVDKAHTGCRSDVEESGAEIDFKAEEEEEEGRDDGEGSQLQLIRKHGTVTSCTSNQDIYERNMKKDYHHHDHHHCKSSMINSGASAGGAGIPENVMWADPESYTSDHAVAPVSAWSTLANRTLLCRPLPVDVGRCVCYITRERKDGINGYALYTDEGHGRRDRKLAVAHHRRRTGRSEFLVFPADKDSRVAMLGRIQANVVGSRYAIWDEVDLNCTQKGPGGTSARSRPLLGVVMFQPTVTTLAGTYRVMQVSIPKYQSMQILPSTIHQQQQQREISRNNGLPPDSWDSKSRSKNLSKNNVHRLYSRKPSYNKAARRYELDF